MQAMRDMWWDAIDSGFFCRMKNSSCTVSLHLKKKKSTHEFSCKVPNAFLHPVTVSTPGNIHNLLGWGGYRNSSKVSEVTFLMISKEMKQSLMTNIYRRF